MGQGGSPSIHPDPFIRATPLSPLLYGLALELFLYSLRANLVLGQITLPGVTTSAKYTACTNKVSILVMSKIDEVRREIRMYETVTGTKINPNKSWKLHLSQAPSVGLGIWFSFYLQLEKN